MSFQPPIPGVLLDNKYRLAERIGGGGMGDVYRAEAVANKGSVAIKFLHPELAQNAELSQRFFQEARAVTRIRHPNVVDVVDVGVGDFGPYIVMEYLDGESVGAALLRVGRFEVEAAVGTAIPVLEALDAAHRAGIIHRDLKPENVFIAIDVARNAATVRLLDFGIAKMLDSGGASPRTRTGVVFGTPDYLSPEQATGDAPLDGRSDLFAVGVLLYEMLTGTRPFRGPTAVATAFRVVHAEAPSIAGTGVTVDSKLESILHRLLQKDPARRYPTALEVTRDLERFVPDPARRAGALGRVINLARRMTHATPPPPPDPNPRRAPPDLGYLVTQMAQRSQQSFVRFGDPPAPIVRPEPAPSRPHPPASDMPRSPRHVADLPKTIRSSIDQVNPRPSEPEQASVVSIVAPLARTSSIGPLTPVRAFPQRFVGRYQVRGPVLRSVDRVIGELFGADARAEIVAHMPEGYAADFRNDSINALVAYDLEALDAYMEYATAMVVRDASRWRDIGRTAVEGDLLSVVRTLLRPSPDLAGVVRRGTAIWARLFSFGSWRVVVAPSGKVELHIADFDPVGQPLRHWVAGMVEQTVRRAVRPEVRAVITLGEPAFAPELALELG